jgi:hypothetical protein
MTSRTAAKREGLTSTIVAPCQMHALPNGCQWAVATRGHACSRLYLWEVDNANSARMLPRHADVDAAAPPPSAFRIFAYSRPRTHFRELCY